MASKKDRGKGKIVNPSDNKSLAIKPESSPIGTPAASPTTTSLALTNRFMTFSPEPNITFSSALATEFSPFLGPSIRPRMPFIKAEKPSAYIRLPFFQHLFFIEIGMAPIKDPSQLAIAYFPSRFHWVPEHPLKDISYYTTILVETKSVHFKPILDQKTGKTLYMSVYFDKVLLLKDWGEHPSQPRILSNSELSYSYYDYIDAWFRFMQTSIKKDIEKPLISLPEERRGISLKTNSQKNLEKIEEMLQELSLCKATQIMPSVPESSSSNITSNINKACVINHDKGKNIFNDFSDNEFGKSEEFDSSVSNSSTDEDIKILEKKFGKIETSPKVRLG
jgi:hypothetical protein